MRVLALAIAVVVAPLPVLAGEVGSSTHASGSLAAAAEKAVVTATQQSSPQARFSSTQSEGARTDLSSGGFFKTKAGIITLVAVGVGLGVALYSTSNDRVKSPNVTYGNGGR
jgi:hypothetical protein